MKMFSVREAAESLGISTSLVYALIQAGVIRHTRHGRPGKRGCIRISEEAVAEYLATCERQGAVGSKAGGERPLRHIR
jgi:excisionase family DNA binding protein